jgi:hypothetical protein
MFLRRPILLRKVPLRGRVQPQQQLVPDEICPGLRGCGAAGSAVVSVQLPRKLPPVPLSALARLPAPNAVSTGAALRPLAPRPKPRLKFGLELRREPPVHYHRISAATAPAPWLFPWGTHLRASCGASSARSSICAYIALVAHRRTPEQSADRGGHDTRVSIGPSSDRSSNAFEFR